MTAIERIHEFARFGSRLGLERMRALMGLLGDPQKNLRYIHVAGTNGKGSVCRFIYSALRCGGYRVGLFTSPFIVSFYERFEYDGAFIGEDELEEVADVVLSAASRLVSEGGDSPTEFEILTAIAFVYFSRKNPDFVVLEVGLGGLGDSTNIIDEAAVSAITPISLDHMEQLGNTIEEIAAQKAGIIKKGCPVVCGAGEEAEGVIRRRAEELGCRFVTSAEVSVKNMEADRYGASFDAAFHAKTFKDIKLSMLGPHQVENARIAIAALETLRENHMVSLPASAMTEGLRAATLPGRLEVMSKAPLIIADGAHNPAGAKALAAAMLKLFPDERILVVAGMLRDKDIRGVLKELRSFAAAFIATEPEGDRSLPAGELAAEINADASEAASIIGVESNPQEALNLAISAVQNEKYDMIVITGSLYLIGAIHQILD